MTRRIREKLIDNLDREINIVNSIAIVLIILLGVFLVPMLFGIIILPDVVVPSILYKIYEVLLPIGLLVEWCIVLCYDSLKAIQYAIEYEQVDIHKNKLLNVILSDSKALDTFFGACTWISLILSWNSLLFFIFVMLWLVAPKKIAKRFKNKLIREKEL